MRLPFSTGQISFHKAGVEFDGRGPRLAHRMGMLRAVIASLPQVFICLEASGECSPWYLLELLKTLGDNVRESQGREYPSLRGTISKKIFKDISPGRPWHPSALIRLISGIMWRWG